jgi:hypothetical protein
MYVSRVDPSVLAFSLSSDRHTCASFLFNSLVSHYTDPPIGITGGRDRPGHRHRCIMSEHDVYVSEDTKNELRFENRPANRTDSRETGLEMPCCPTSDLLWVQITQSYPNRLRFSTLPCPQSPCHTVIDPVFKEGFFPR